MNLVSAFKLLVVRSILQMGVDVMYSDSDILLYQNPIPVIQSFPFDSMAFQKDISLCAGFFYARPTPLSFDILERSLRYITKRHMDDQLSMILSFRDKKRNVTILPVSQFQSGDVFFTSVLVGSYRSVNRDDAQQLHSGIHLQTVSHVGNELYQSKNKGSREHTLSDGGESSL